MPNGVLYGTLSVANQLRKTDLGGIAQGGTLSAAVELGNGPTDHFYVSGDVAGTLTVPYVDTDFQVTGGVIETGSITVYQSFDTTGFPAAALGGIAGGGSVHIGSLAGELHCTGPMLGTLEVVEDQTGALVLDDTATGTLMIGGDVEPGANIQIANYASLYNLAMPNGVLYGALSVGDVLRKADLAGIAADAKLNVAVQIGNGPTDHFYVNDDVAGALTVPYVDTAFQVAGAVTSTGVITIYQSLDTAGYAEAGFYSVASGGTVQIGTLAW